MKIPRLLIAYVTPLLIAGMPLTLWTSHSSENGHPPQRRMSTDELVAIQAGSSPFSPDEFSWRIFAAISGTAPQQQQLKRQDGQIVQTNDVCWERWADNGLTFQPATQHTVATAPAVDPCSSSGSGPPLPSGKNLQQDPILLLLNDDIHISAPPVVEQFARNPSHNSTAIGGNAVGAPVAGTLEEVRRNHTSFNFLRSKNYVTQGGLADAVQHRPAGSGVLDSIFSLPSGSIEVKAFWAPQPDCKPIDIDCGKESKKIHINFTPDGKRFGLIALHIMTKVKDKWVWSTWEWAGDGNTADGLDGNPGRCDYIGCVDKFGSKVGWLWRHGVTRANRSTAKGYRPAPLTRQLEELFRTYNLAPEWRAYRLKVTQVDFNKPEKAGNSQIEATYVPSSSCFTCHARAGVNFNGTINLRHLNPPLFNAQGEGPLGPIRPEWFVHSTPSAPPVQVYYRTDFIWSVMRAPEGNASGNTPGSP